jgi:hypothetical protein
MEAVQRDWVVTSLHRGGGATNAELIQTKVYEQHCLALVAAMGPYSQPTNEQLALAVEALANQITALSGQISAQMTTLNGRVNGLEAEMQVGNRRLLAAEARHRNRSAMDPADALSPVPHGTGPVPAVFPATRRDLTDMTVPSMNLLLAYYELSGVGNADAKRSRLYLHLGLRLRPSEAF